ncbi:MAG: asparagine synthase (glutamine-hydrolyzing) [Arcobacteraceae bacterium]|nr:asparagine synthase (glutamine-hydrolyzing) [Arcobacteraceae bacterium]
MCGIVGTSFNPKCDFKYITKLMSNRGPDFCDIKQIKNNFFGHSRLSIIDLNDEANQPMLFDDILIVFNGEIYNYKELIKNENLECETSSDTEVLIRLYQKYETDFLNLLNGAFGFCIYDIKKDRFFCARDRYGKKPFYYYNKNDKFIFASTIKPIIKILGFTPKINKVALSQYLQYFVPLAPNTFYTDILKLDAATFLVFEKGQLTTKKYYKINTDKKIHDEPTALKNIEEILISSIEKRLVSDVEVGSLLSGGIDSSLISAICSKISSKQLKTFSIGYETHKQYSELNYAKTLADHINSDHHPLIINKCEFIDSLDDVLENLEEPHADPAAIPLYLLTKKINQTGIKTVLSGEGSDELFLGYDNYAKFLKYYQFKESLSLSQHDFLDEIIGALSTQTKESEYLKRVIKDENIYNSFGEIFTPTQRKKLFIKTPNFKTEKPKKNPVDWMSYIDTKIWLGEALLSKVDKMSMANSIETRNPFLDFRLVDTAFSIDSNLKLGNTNKYLLKKVASKYIPQEIIQRQKKGFNSPYNEWLFEEFKDDILNTIIKVNNQTDFFNEKYIKFIYESASNNKFKQHLYALWLFSKWYEKTYL